MGSRFEPDRSRQVADAAFLAEQRRQSMIRRIDAALARIEAGQYGYCTRCGGQIAASQLDHEPTTAFCVACAGGTGPEMR
ncbi:TraR/DksA family transcriptional regulator [Allostella humosa]|uniref:TraR/DksA family transcriptional regulator n=1 Tax=Stella humosa TaxID=94 RepID=UPI000F4C2348|nr:hypothetical protein [Stella humosa]